MNLNAAELLATADAVQTWAQRNEAIANLAAVIGKIGVVTQAADEAELRLAKAQGEIETAKADLHKMRQDIEAADRSRDNTLVKASAEADNIITTAKATAEGIVFRAGKAATEQAAAIVADAEAARAKASAERDALVADVAEAKSALDAVRAQNEAAAAELAATEAKIAAAKAAIAKALA